MRKIIILSLALALVVGLVGVADAAGRGAGQKRAEAAAKGIDMDRNLERNAAKRLPAPRFVGARVPGTIQYDNGVFNLLPGTSGICYGNQFDTTGGANPLTASGSITAASIYMAAASGGVFVSIFDQQAGTGANLITSFSTPMVTGLNPLAIGPFNYVGATFLAGAWNFTAGGDTVGLGTGSTGGQGFHGMSINDIAATGFNRPGTYNGIVRASGNIIAIPVELTGFEIVGE